MTPVIKSIIDDIIKAEGGYSNNPNDSGGETMYGITKAVAVANGYSGAMKDLPISLAENIYYTQYVSKPKFDLLLPLSESIAAEVIDTGVNMGPSVAGKFLQRCLNAFNNQGKAYADITVDGKVGTGTASALKSYLGLRGKQGEIVMLKALNCLQGARYIELAEGRQANEDFVYGWIANRISL